MPVDEKTRRALDIKSLPVLPGLPVIKLEAEDYTNWEGDPALRVLAVIDESTDVEHVSGAVVGDLKRAIIDNLRKHGITLFPYIFLAKPSELAETDDEE